MNQAFRDGWDRIFGPKQAAPTHRCPFMLRKGLLIHLDLPDDLELRDLRRLVWYLATMSSDWEPEMGFPVLTFPDAEKSGEFSRGVHATINGIIEEMKAEGFGPEVSTATFVALCKKLGVAAVEKTR